MKSTHLNQDSIPTEHMPVSVDCAVPFSLWLEEQLEDLESRFEEFATNHSVMSNITSARK